MKKITGFLALLAAMFILAVMSERVTFGRLTSDAASRDVWCVGISGLEVCVDSSGNFIPTTTNVSDLGTSTLKFKNLYLDGTATVDTIAGTAATFSGTVAHTGAVTSVGASGIKVSTSATSATSVSVMGSVVTLSTVPARAGLIYFQSSDLKLFISTRAAVANETTGAGTVLYKELTN